MARLPVTASFIRERLVHHITICGVIFPIYKVILIFFVVAIAFFVVEDCRGNTFFTFVARYSHEER